MNNKDLRRLHESSDEGGALVKRNAKEPSCPSRNWRLLCAMLGFVPLLAGVITTAHAAAYAVFLVLLLYTAGPPGSILTQLKEHFRAEL